MKVTSIVLVLALLTFVNCSDDDENGPSTSCPEAESLTVTESEGLVIFEAEAVPDLNNIGEWQFRNGPVNGISEFSGDGYLFYAGENSFRDAGNSVIEYSINIATPGVYRFLYAAAIGTGTNNTEHNDAFVNFPNADAFYAYRSNSNTIAIPNDEGVNTDNPDPGDPILDATYQGATYKVPEGSNSRNDGYFKVYMNQLDDFWYEGSTSDSDAHSVYVRFDNPGSYTLLISGRSNSFAIDRIVLFIEQGDFENIGGRNNRLETFNPIESDLAVCP